MHSLKSRWGVLLMAMLLAVFAVAAACDDDDDDDADNGVTSGETADNDADGDADADDAMEDDAMEDDAMEDDASAKALQATVVGVDSDAAGTVTIATNADGKTEVTVSLTGLTEGNHANHLHHGSCEAQGEVHVALSELVADADGNAQATTTVDDLDVAHFAEGHYYAVHAEGDDTVGDVIGCGDVVAADHSGDDTAAAVTLEATVAGVDSDAAGTVTIAANADGTTEVTVSLSGLAEGKHANHVHHGSCAEQGEVHVALAELEADADGNAQATTTVDDLEVSHFAEGHYFAVHAEGDDTVGDVIGCGDVVAQAS